MASATVEYGQHEQVRLSAFYSPWPKQNLFHICPAKYRLLVGSFGSGKSRPLLMEAIAHCIAVPGSNNILLRKTIPDLKRTVIDKFLSDVPKALYERGSQEKGTYNHSDHIVYFPPVPQFNKDGSPKIGVDGQQETMQSKLFFSACERIEDVGKYLSTEFLFVGFEELGEFSYPIWSAFEGRNRCTIPGSRPCMAGATNPMGIGWGWIQTLWVKKKPLRGMDPEKYNPRQYWFVHSTVDDNPIYSQDKEYVESLERSPIADKVRWGMLETVSGQYFSNYDPSRHELAVKDFIFEPWNPVWIGWDYGFGHYAVITFWTKARLKPRLPIETERVVNVTIGELVLQEKTIEEQAHAVIAHLPRIGQIINMQRMPKGDGSVWYEPERDETDPVQMVAPIESIYFSWERFIASTKKNGQKRSIADDLGDILAANGIVRPVRANTDRVACWTKMYSMLEYDEWFILGAECPTLTWAVPLAVRGDGQKVSLEDVVKPKGLSLEDDVLDGARHAVSGILLDEGDKPESVKLRDKLAGIKDPFMRHVELYKHQNREAAKERRTGPGGVGRVVPTWQHRLGGK